MPRTHISVARFYDWSSDLGDCVSVSQLYQNFERHKNSVISPRASPAVNDSNSRNIRLHPLTGRMFVKDKTPSLTKGEREIIDGICRNRSDVIKSGPSPVVEDAGFLRHSDAWIRARRNQQPKIRYTHAKIYLELADEKQRLDASFASSEKPSCSLCKDCSKQAELQLSEGTPQPYVTEEGPAAPPSTPEKLLNRREKVPPINNGCGAVYIERVEDSDDPETFDNKRKTFLNVFLPKMHSDDNLDGENSRLYAKNEWILQATMSTNPTAAANTGTHPQRPKRPSTSHGSRGDRARRTRSKDSGSRMQ